MTEEARLARNAYMRDWRKRNPDKVKQYAAQHWERVAAAQEEAKK